MYDEYISMMSILVLRECCSIALFLKAHLYKLVLVMFKLLLSWLCGEDSFRILQCNNGHTSDDNLLLSSEYHKEGLCHY